MKSFEDLNFLKVKGVNQMAKEIAETHDLDRKVIDRAALHRNEQSNEFEGMVQTLAKKEPNLKITKKEPNQTMERTRKAR